MTSQGNNLNCIIFLKHIYEYHTKKSKYRDLTRHFKGFAMINLLIHTVFVAKFSRL